MVLCQFLQTTRILLRILRFDKRNIHERFIQRSDGNLMCRQQRFIYIREVMGRAESTECLGMGGSVGMRNRMRYPKFYIALSIPISHANSPMTLVERSETSGRVASTSSSSSPKNLVLFAHFTGFTVAWRVSCVVVAIVRGVDDY